jgi:uncharacterized protein with von Willebrand factor type A (vWA) domain
MDIVKNNFLRPTAKLDDQKFEFIFLLDISSSMCGQPIELAKKAVMVKIRTASTSFHFLEHNI